MVKVLFWLNVALAGINLINFANTGNPIGLFVAAFNAYAAFTLRKHVGQS